MSDRAMTLRDDPIGSAVPDLEEKFRRVIDCQGRLDRCAEMRKPDPAVRYETRRFKAAVEDLFDDAEIGEIVSYIGAGTFTDYFNYIAGTEIEASAVSAADVFPLAGSITWPQATGGLS